MTRHQEREAFQDLTGVSRETMSRLDLFEDLLRKWNSAINLVAKSTLDTLWQRHLLDSAQVFTYSQANSGLWADLGSGAGFPGLLIAILAAEECPALQVTLVEADARKAAFLATAVRECGLKSRIIAERIERTEPLGANFLSARALAPLPKLLEYAERHLDPMGAAYLSKGGGWREEIAAARGLWRFDVTPYPSKTDANAAILEVKGIARA